MISRLGNEPKTVKSADLQELEHPTKEENISTPKETEYEHPTRMDSQAATSRKNEQMFAGSAQQAFLGAQLDKAKPEKSIATTAAPPKAGVSAPSGEVLGLHMSGPQVRDLQFQMN